MPETVNGLHARQLFDAISIAGTREVDCTTIKVVGTRLCIISLSYGHGFYFAGYRETMSGNECNVSETLFQVFGPFFVAFIHTLTRDMQHVPPREHVWHWPRMYWYTYMI